MCKLGTLPTGSLPGLMLSAVHINVCIRESGGCMGTDKKGHTSIRVYGRVCMGGGGDADAKIKMSTHQ